jgi:hypothetical protein
MLESCVTSAACLCRRRLPRDPTSRFHTNTRPCGSAVLKNRLKRRQATLSASTMEREGRPASISGGRVNVPNFSGVRRHAGPTICGRTRDSRARSMRPQRGAHASQRGDPHAKARTSPVSSDSPHTPEGRAQASNVRALRRALSVLYCGASFRKHGHPSTGRRGR